MNATQLRRGPTAGICFCAAVAALSLAVMGAMVLSTGAAAAQRSGGVAIPGSGND
jgi:hypothetical protein